MLIYNIDYSAVRKTGPEDETAEIESVKIVKIAGYSSPESANGAKGPKEGVSRMRAEGPADLASLNPAILRALYAFKAKDGKVPEGMEDGALPEAVWATFEPAKKDRSAPLQSGSTDGISSVSGDGAATEGKMAKGKGKTKTATKKKAAKKSTGTRGVKSGEVKRLLLRKGGCTRKEILDTTGWPTVSVQAMAKSAGLKLRVEKVKGKPMQYFGTEK